MNREIPIRFLVAAVLALGVFGCKRNVPVALSLAMNEDGGCVELKPNPKFGKFVCWGPERAATRNFPGGDPTKITLGARNKGCGFFGSPKLKCWEGEGAPADTGMFADDGVKVAIGPHHICAASKSNEHFQCEGNNDQGQFGVENEWLKYPIQFVAAGEASTCIGWEQGAGILCRGRGAPKEPMLVGSELTDLRAGPSHTCAVTKAGRLYCWGKNDAGQLGDGTTNDAAVPTVVPGLEAVAAVAIGARHTCALLGNRTVTCWGANDRHQLANGTTAPSSRPAMVLGALGVWEIAAAGDATCARLGVDGEIRCWGANDRGQLGDDSHTEHTVPATIKFR